MTAISRTRRYRNGGLIDFNRFPQAAQGQCHGNAVERHPGLSSFVHAPHANGVPQVMETTACEAMRGVMAVVAMCRLMATVCNDRLLVVDRVPRVRREARRPWAAECHHVVVKNNRHANGATPWCPDQIWFVRDTCLHAKEGGTTKPGHLSWFVKGKSLHAVGVALRSPDISDTAQPWSATLGHGGEYTRRPSE